MVKMKRLQHYKFISSIRSRAAPARCSCSGRQSRQAGGRPAEQTTLCFPTRGDLAGPTPSARTISSVAPGSWAESSGVVFMWQSKASSGIPERLLRIHFHPWPQIMARTRPQRREATVAPAEFADLPNNPPRSRQRHRERLGKQVLHRR